MRTLIINAGDGKLSSEEAERSETNDEQKSCAEVASLRALTLSVNHTIMSLER